MSNTNLNTFLDKLKDVTNVAYDIFVPSLNRTVKFKAITTGQQKSLIKSVLDKELMGVTFNFALNKIIQENCTEPVQLTVADRTPIAVQLRVISLGSEVTIEKNKFSIEKLCADIKAGKKSVAHKESEIVEGDVKLLTGNPTLTTDNQGLDYLIKALKNDVSDKTKSSNMFAAMLTVEISKYINTVEVGTDGEAIVDFKLITVPQRVNVVDSLPAGLVKQMLEVNTTLKKQEEVYTTTEKGEQFTVDSSFFTVVNE